MSRSKVQAIILAAGKSSRFNTESTKLSFTLCGQEMIAYPAKLLADLAIPMTFVVGFQKQAIKKIINNHEIPEATFIEQVNQNGTGHALACTQKSWHAENILILNGDIPLVTRDIIEQLIDQHTKENACVSFVTSHMTDPSAVGYGRVIKKDDGKVEIIEARNYTGEDLPSQLINAGIYLINKKFLEETLSHITPNEKTGEIYITDLVKAACDQNKMVTTTWAPFDYVRGVNTLKELWAAEHIKRSELITYWMSEGVRFAAALNICLDLDIEIGAGTFIGTGVVLLAGTKIGKNCVVNGFSFISNSIIHNNVHIKPHSAICDSEIHDNSQIGPFAHLNKAIIEQGAIVGNFVEIERSTLGKESSARHSTFLGDTTVGNNVHIGAGTITCNYNGASTHETIIKNGALVGSNSTLIAPVTIGEESITGAGSVITNDVPDKALAIARVRQTNKEQYAEQLREQWSSQEITPSPIIYAKKVDRPQKV
jgi:bifunctional UDP-N-acetylglucosamine pyrophosphorylase/glucosamine-1-phosphate N-acetyltransferase